MESISKKESRIIPHLNSRSKQPSTKLRDHHSSSIHNEMTTPKSFHDATTPTENRASYAISDLLHIAIKDILAVYCKYSQYTVSIL